MRALFDTNVLVDYLNGHRQAADEISLYDERLISRVSWMETLAGVPARENEGETRRFLECFIVLEITPSVAERTVAIRRDLGLRLPDAIILATAREAGALLVTRNTKDFSLSWPEVRVPYKLQSPKA